MASPLEEKLDRIRRAAEELQSSLNALGGENFVEEVTANIEVVNFQEVQDFKPRRIFTVKVCVNHQQPIHP
ncbi:MAG: hypothetical protein JSS23_03120 [Proteobacteria bacterium]|nr:hypothetical protein [Pseudomonadota bacterium]